MGEKANKTKSWLITPKIKPFQFLIAISGILLFVFMETNIFKEGSDIAKVITYVCFIVASVLSGISLIDLKEIGLKFKAIIQDRKLDAWGKVRAFMSLGVEVMTKAGEAWELYNDEQFEEQKKIDKPTASLEQ